MLETHVHCTKLHQFILPRHVLRSFPSVKDCLKIEENKRWEGEGMGHIKIC